MSNGGKKRVKIFQSTPPCDSTSTMPEDGSKQRQFSEAQMEELKSTFELFDKDGDGAISCSELGDIMRALGGNPTDDEVSQMIKAHDTDGSKKIEFSEFVTMMSERNEDPDDEMIAAFRVFDRNGDGFITVAELKCIMNNLGENLTDEDCKEMVAKADIDGDGKINYEEFVKMMNE